VITLLLFCKRPQLGFGKQRLASEIGKQKAFEVATLLLECALEDLRSWSGDTIISPSCSEESDWAQELIQNHSLVNCSVHPQQSGNMGERIQDLDRNLRGSGTKKIVIIGSDSPYNSPQHFSEVITLLNSNDVVLTPATDGGVTIMANRITWPPLKDLPWSDHTFGKALKECSIRNGNSVTETEDSFDIDTKDDLVTFFIRSEKDTRQSRVALHNWIRENIL